MRGHHRGARFSNSLLERPDRFFGVVLIGNTFANSASAALTAVLGLRLGGDAGFAVATLAVSMLTLICSEITPKTLAAIHPERIAFPASYVLVPLLRLLSPLVWFVNIMSNGLLRLFGVKLQGDSNDQLTADELRTVVRESGKMISPRYRGMLLNILDLGQMTVQDIMVPRTQVVGIDLDRSDEEISSLLQDCDYTRMPVFHGEINNALGILHVRKIVQWIEDKNRNGNLREFIVANIREPYFVPETTPLNVQLLNFQKKKRRIALVVDEYSDVQGVVTLEDILEEIVGEFTSNIGEVGSDIQRLAGGRVQIDCGANIRAINRYLDWNLPADSNGARTLNGLIVNHLGSIPGGNVCFNINGHYFETQAIADNRIKSVIVFEKKW